MRNIPIFSTKLGVASLTLSNIPYTKAAYVRIQDSLEPEKFLKECCDFCVAVGAEFVFASGKLFLEKYAVYSTILELKCFKNLLPEGTAKVIPVNENNMERWRNLYWMRMRDVPTAAYISASDMPKFLRENQCYFVTLQETEIGIGMVKDDEIVAVAGSVPGMGKEVLLALCKQISGEKIKVRVAKENIPAMKLYTSLGFCQASTVSTWYKIY